jgi:hypothetical protein
MHRVPCPAATGKLIPHHFREAVKKAVEAAFTLWLFIITIRYAQTVLRSLAFPINSGMDIEWLTFWLITVSFVAIYLLLSPRALRIWMMVTATVIIMVAILSGTLLTTVLMLWFVAVAYAWGTWLLRIGGVEPDDPVQSISIAVPLGLLVPASVGFVLACSHLLTGTSVRLALLALTVLQLRTILGFGRTNAEIGKLSLDVAFPIAVTLPVVILNFIWAIAPEIQFDPNNYHLAVPKVYLANAGFIDMPFVHILPIVCVLAVATVFYWRSTGFSAAARRLCLLFGLILQFPSTPVQFWNIPERFPIGLAFARETPDRWSDMLQRAT